MLIRNKKEAVKLSREIAESSEDMRRQGYLKAIEADDKLYLNCLYASLSTKDLVRLILEKIQNRSLS